MGLLYPTALFLLGLIPILAIAYMIRERPQRITVSSIIAFRALSGIREGSFWGRLKLDWLFYAEALILALGVAALADPYLVRPRKPVAVVLDNSAAMQAKMPSGQTRFQAARDRLAATLSDNEPNVEVSVFATAPRPQRLAGPLDSVVEARSAIGEIRVTDAPNDPDVLRRQLGSLIGQHHFSEIIYAGMRPIDHPPAQLTPITVGAAFPNYAIGSFSVRRGSLGTEALRGRLTIANFSPQAQTLAVTVKAGGKALAHAEAHLDPDETGVVEFPELALADIYRAEITPNDNFELDNVAYATAGASKSLRLLFVSPTSADAQGLTTLPGVTVLTIKPEDFSPGSAAQADLIVFEYTIPKELPADNALLVMPPPGDPVFGFAIANAPSIQVTGWKSSGPLTDGVNFRLLNLRKGEFFDLHPWMEAEVRGNGGGLLLSGVRQGHRYIAAGFNPFPYLGRQNLPMSVLTLNILSYLAGLDTDSAGYRTGQPWLVPAGVGQMILPSGKPVAVQPGSLFTGAVQQGVYQLVGPGGEKSYRAVNLANLAESNFEVTPALKLEVPIEGKAPAGTFNANFSLNTYLIAALLAIAVLESFAAYRRRRRPLAVQQ